MKRLFILIGILAVCLSASAQISRIEYFWNTDPGFGNAIGLPISPGDTVSAVFSFATIGLQPGLHTLYVRSQDAQGKWSVFSKKVIQIKEPVYSITKAEYFYDIDPGFGNGTNIPITTGDSIELAPAFPTNALTPGMHTLYVRVKDANNKWSVFSKKAIHIQQPFYPIAAAEYFVDTDPGFGNGTPITITPGDSIELTPAINTASLSTGIHTVYVRVKSTDGGWSVFSKRLIHIQYPEASEIIAAEYFVDTDPGFGNATVIPLTAGDSVFANFQVPTASLSLGIHMIYIRVKDNDNQWSVFSKKLLYIDNPADDPVVAAEYFIDSDPGVGNGTAISITPGDTVVKNFSAPTNSLLIGAHWIYVRVKDAEERWSVYSRDSFYVDNFNCLIYGNGEIELIGDTCRGTQITFKDKTTSNSGVNSADFTREWDFFNDTVIDFTPDSVVQYTFNQIGTYSVNLKVYETNNPVCQEIISKTFTIRRIDTTYSNVSICDGLSHFAGGANQTESGVYEDIYANRYGCDSVHITTLAVIDNVTPALSIVVDDDSICSGTYVVFNTTPVNGGSAPYYTWKVNGVIVSQGYGYQAYSAYGSTTLADGDVVNCTLNSNETCVTVNNVISNSITMDVIQSVSASITIAVDTNNFCYGTEATFSVTNVANEGSNPQYAWYVNHVLTQTGGTTFTSSVLGSGNFVYCYLYSDAVCVSNSPVASNTISLTSFATAFPDVVIAPSTNNVCYGTPVTLSAYSVSYGGNNPNYQWFLNGALVQNGSSNSYSNDSLDDNDEIKCVLTSDYQCRLADTDTSNTVTMDIIYFLPVSVTLSPSGNNICEGTGVSFSANVTNGGSPNYQFFVNGNSVQNSSLYYYSYTTANNDSVWVVVTSDILCATNNPATSDKIFMTVVEYDTVSVSITATEDTICQGEEIIFSADALNAGIAPNYLWRVNNAQAQYGAADTFASSSFSNGSIVRCELYGDHQCVTPIPAVSNNITITVNDTLRPKATASIPQTTICQGTQVDFDITLTNEGNNPTIEWLLNNNVVQTGDLFFTSSTLADFDVVRVRLTVDYVCPVQNPVLSNPVVITVIDSVTPAVFVYHGPNPGCPGNLISVFTTTSTGGDAPTYQFRVNGNLGQSGVNSQYNSVNFTDGDVVQVAMTSNAECIRNTIALSNFDTIKINQFVPADVSIQTTTLASCVGELSTFQATPTNGGTNPIYTWRVNNVVFQSNGSNIFNTTALQDGDSVYCDMSSSLACATNNPARSNTIHLSLPGCVSCDTVVCVDGDACTVDTCINGQCFFTALNCSDNNPCTIDKCESGICEHADKVCADSNLCTVDLCNLNGDCIFIPIDCNDGTACTTDFCDTLTGECGHSGVVCAQDTDSCTIEICDVIFGCISIPKDCSDSDACTQDLCQDNHCTNPPVICNPLDACHTATCDNGTCIQTPLACDDADLCTVNGCDILTSCYFVPVNCSDGNSCTNDFCDLGICSNDTIIGCGNPCDTLVCFDANLCTIDGCDLILGCTFMLINCNDGNGCTDDFCDLGICNHDSIPNCDNPCDTLVCFDNTVCTVDGCDSLTGCTFTPLFCVDGNNCTIDGCDSLTGCTFTPILCNDNDLCTTDQCISILGCIFTPLNCNDGNSCTNDFCDFGICSNDTIIGCGNPCDTMVCNDNNLCTDDICLNAQCQFTPINCSDGNPCTFDSCFNGICSHGYNLPDAVTATPEHDACQTYAGMQVYVNNVYIVSESTLPEDFQLLPEDIVITYTGFLFNDTDSFNSCDVAVNHILRAVTCDDSNPCTVDECSHACFNFPLDCADGNACTDDICAVGNCLHPQITCSDNNLCTTDGCDTINGCVFTPIVCGDNNFCTMDNCDSTTGCVYPAVVCADNSLCTTDDCNAITGCVFTPVVCDDANLCTVNNCAPQLGCIFPPVNCADNNLCTIDNCDIATGCVYTDVVCDDNDLCTTDTCFAQSGCAFAPVSCDDRDSCTIDKCEFGVCVNAPVICFDGDFCTLDTCISGTCFFLPITCADGDVCTDDACAIFSGCQFTPLDCNDGNACTNDFCDSAFGCAFTQVNCDDGNACTAEYCELIFGCTYTFIFCDDSSLCTIDACDALTGCSFTPINCDDREPCTFDFCDNGDCLHLCDENSNHELIWQKALGGNSADGARSIHQTTDGGYIVTGYAFSNNGDIIGNHGQSDFWAARLDANGNLLWQKALGGGKSESANSVKQTADGGYILAGNTKSTDGDVTGNHGGEDFWVVKLDAAGNLAWQKTLGGNNADIASSVAQTTDGGYIVAGYTSSNNGDVSGNHGGSDYWVVKLDAVGNLAWQKTLGGTSSDQATSIEQTSDGGYVIAGNTKSNNGDVSGNHGASDFWVVKLDGAGNLSWQKTLGGSNPESAHAVEQTADGGYLVAGSSQSNNGDVSDNKGGDDFWVVKLDGAGTLAWQKNFGGSADDAAQSIAVTSDNGFLIAGNSKSTDDDVTGNHGNDDFWTIRLDATGDLLWQKSLGGNKKDNAFSAQQTVDEGFILAGFSDSQNNGDVTGHHSSSDFWVLKLASDRVCKPVTELASSLCAGDSIFFGNNYIKESGVFTDSLMNHIGCDSIVVLTLSVADCDDGDPCTVDLCENGVCSYIPLLCEDNDACTLDDCDTQQNGCFFTPIICNDNNPCTTDECHFGACLYQPVICDDNNACTIDECVNGVCEFVDERKVLSFTLVDAATDLDLGILHDGDTINLAVSPAINIRADVCATSNIESVKFLLNGSFYVFENIPFYTIAGDNNGNYNPWNITPGVYTIRAIPFSGNNGAGIIGRTHEITITIINSVSPCSGNARKVLDFSLVDAATETDIAPLLDGDTINLAVTPLINVRANVCLENNIESVRFLLNGSNYRMENIPFYTIAGDNGGNYIAWNITPGVYTIRAIPYSGNIGAGAIGDYHEITVVIIDGLPQPCTTNDIRVSSFTLINANTDTDIGPLVDGAVINLALTGPINVRANVFCGEQIGMIRFKLNGVTYRNESTAPYSIAGDNPSGNYHAWNVQPGVYTILATPYSGANATGTVGTPLSITITIIGSAAKMDSQEQIPSLGEMESINQISAYPNPFTDKLNIEFTLPEDSRVNLEIFNLTGQRIADLFEGNVEAGELQKHEFTPDKLSDGMFIYRLQTENGSYYGKAVMVR